jgi:hypothetical protein
MTTIKEACRNYFHLIRHPKEQTDKKGKALTAAAILSCITLIVPAAVALVYGISKLAGRVKKSQPEPNVQNAAETALTPSSSSTSSSSTISSSKSSSSTSSSSKSSSVSSSSESIDPEEQELLNQFTPQMVEALGGIEAVKQMPIFANWGGTTGPRFAGEQVPPAPITRYYDSYGTPFLVFYYFKKEPSGWSAYVDCLCKEENGWMGPSSELGRTMVGKDLFKEPNAEWERVLLDKVRRLVRGEAVGLLKEYSSVLPEDVVMQGEDYAALGLRYYELKPEGGPTGIFLGDPTKDVAENLRLARARFTGN